MSATTYDAGAKVQVGRHGRSCTVLETAKEKTRVDCGDWSGWVLTALLQPARPTRSRRRRDVRDPSDGKVIAI